MIIRTTPSNVTTTSSTTATSRKRGTTKNTSTTRKTTDETDEERTLHDDDNDDDDHVSNSTPTTTTSSPKNDDERKSSSRSTTSTKQRQHKGPKRLLTGRPKRARSAYNYFFRSERAKFMGVSEEMLDEEENSKQYKRKHRKTPGMIGFANLASVVGQKWKDLSAEEKEIFEEKARQDKQRFDKELAIWKEKQQQKQKENAVVPAYYGRGNNRDVVDYNHPATMPHRPQRVLSSALIWEQRPQGGGPPAPYYGPDIVSAAPSYPPYGPPNHPRPYLRQPYPYHPPNHHHPHPHQHQYYAPSSSHPRPHFREPHQYGSWEQTPTSHVDVVPNAITSCDSTCSSLSAGTSRGGPTASSSSAPTSPYQAAPSGAVHQHRSPPAVHSQEPLLLLDAEHRYQYPPTKRGRFDLPSQAGHHHHHPQAQRPCYNYRYPYHPEQTQQGAYGPPLPSQVSSGADPRETRQGSFTSGTEEEAEGSAYWDVPSEAAVASGYYNHQGTDMQRHIESDPRQQATPAAPEEVNVGAPSHMTKWREVINEQREGHQQGQAILAVNQEQEPRCNITTVAVATTNEEENREFVSNTLFMDVKAEEQEDAALFSPLSHEEPTPSTIPPRMMLDLLNPPNVYLAREDQGATNQACSRMVDGTSNTVVLASEVAPTVSNVHSDAIKAPCNVQSAAATTSIVTECNPSQVSMQCPTATTAAHSDNGDNNMNGNLDCPFTLKPCASTDSADSRTSNTSAKAREDMLQFLSLICD